MTIDGKHALYMDILNGSFGPIVSSTDPSMPLLKQLVDEGRVELRSVPSLRIENQDDEIVEIYAIY